MAEALNHINEQLFWAMNRPLGAVIDYIFIFFTITGYALLAVPIGFAAMKLYGGLSKQNIKMFAAAIILGGITIGAMKQNIVRDRPLAHFYAQDVALYHKVHAPFKRPHNRTFPSGHSQTGFTVATLMVLLFKKHKWQWFLWAALVAISRVRLGVHFPVDIIAGSLIGILIGWLPYRFFAKKDEQANSNEAASS